MALTRYFVRRLVTAAAAAPAAAPAAAAATTASSFRRATPAASVPATPSSAAPSPLPSQAALTSQFLPPGFRRINLAPGSAAYPTTTAETPDWNTVFPGIASIRVTSESEEILRRPIADADVEVKPDGIIYLPEIKYRRILCDAFGPGGWAIVPRGDAVLGESVVTREYALLVEGRFIAQAQGENPYFNAEQLPGAIEGCKSNALMRCCKDLGIAAQLWDPVYVRAFRRNSAVKLWVTHAVTKKKKTMWVKKGCEDDIPYPYEKS